MPYLVSALRRRDSTPPRADEADVLAVPTDRQARRRPFSTWVKKLTNFKGSSGEGRHADKRNLAPVRMSKKRAPKTNNPYPQSGRVGNGATAPQDSRQSFTTSQSGVTSSGTSVDRSGSARNSRDGRPPPTAGARSTAPTVSTDHEAQHSVTAPSHGASSIAGTSRTANGGVESRRGGDSTFSSPAPSVRSLTTTLTTIQSVQANGAPAPAAGTHTTQHGSSQAIHFSQPFPAIPAHLAPAGAPGHPTTYSTATANNLLTDDASILTLASSTKLRRRRSLDTDASVRALAPSSVFGGSRESLPLSVLSANIDALPTTPGLQHASSRIGAERTSIYSATGILASERNSFYAKQPLAGSGGDGASVRSGLLGHGRADSVTGSIGGITSPLASPREAPLSEKGKGKDGGEGDKERGEE